MYTPKLKYAFCVMRPRSLWSQVPLIKYLNSVGEKPFILIDKRYQETLLRMLKISKVSVQNLNSLPTEYDVMFSESSGHTGFEGQILRTSKKHGKINIKLQTAISVYNRIVNINYIPQKTQDTLHGMCVKGQRSIDHYKKFTKDLFYLNTGDPEWDQFKTDDFKDKVKKIKEKYSEKFLLLGAGWQNIEQETQYYKDIILQAEKRGFKVVIRTHIDLEKLLPACFKDYADAITDRFVLFAAASHVIENISSTMLVECLFLGKRVGCTPAIRHFLEYGRPHKWIANFNEWYGHILPKVGKEMVDIFPRIVTPNEIDVFLSSNDMFTSQDSVDKIFGWPKVSNYSEHLFKTVETLIGGRV